MLSNIIFLLHLGSALSLSLELCWNQPKNKDCVTYVTLPNLHQASLWLSLLRKKAEVLSSIFEEGIPSFHSAVRFVLLSSSVLSIGKLITGSIVFSEREVSIWMRAQRCWGKRFDISQKHRTYKQNFAIAWPDYTKVYSVLLDLCLYLRTETIYTYILNNSLLLVRFFISLSFNRYDLFPASRTTGISGNVFDARHVSVVHKICSNK